MKMDIQSLLKLLLNILSFSQSMLLLCQKTITKKVDIALSVYFWVFCSVPLAYLAAFMQYQTGFISVLLVKVSTQVPTSGECGAYLRTRHLALPGAVSTGPLSLQQSDIRGNYRARTSATGYPRDKNMGSSSFYGK